MSDFASALKKTALSQYQKRGLLTLLSRTMEMDHSKLTGCWVRNRESTGVWRVAQLVVAYVNVEGLRLVTHGVEREGWLIRRTDLCHPVFRVC